MNKRHVNSNKVLATVQIKCNISFDLQLLCYFKNTNFEEDFQNWQDRLTDYCTVASRPFNAKYFIKLLEKDQMLCCLMKDFTLALDLYRVNILLSKKKHRIKSAHCFHCC